MTETVLIVDDEDGVRRTFQEWLAGVPGIRVYAAADAEAALRIVNETPIDLTILDWNLGAGSDGLRLLEDLVEFQPEIVAILVTGFANQATPLDALRMGVRDYLDKNQDLNRATFLAAVKKQLDKIIPAKRQRELNRSLAEFREAVAKVLPLVQGSAALHDPLPLPVAVHTLFRFLLTATGAKSGALVVRHLPTGAPETAAAYGPDGNALSVGSIPFSRTLGASVVSRQEPCIMNRVDSAADDSIDWLPFEQGRSTILAAPLRVGPGLHVILELFDKPEFVDADKKLVAATADVGAELLRRALTERQTHQLLFDAVEAALKASDNVTATLNPNAVHETPSQAVLDRLKRSFAGDDEPITDGETGLRLLEAVRMLAVRHGSPAVDHCLTLIESLRKLLDDTHG